MSDPCWLPSAIMQTAGAIVGIYLIIYVYASDMLLRASNRLSDRFRGILYDTELKESIMDLVEADRSKITNLWRLALFGVLFIGAGTILINTILLWSLLNYPNKIFPRLEPLSVWFFFLLVLAIILYTSLVLWQLKKFEEKFLRTEIGKIV